MIIWSNGAADNRKHLIKGFFSEVYTGPSDIIEVIIDPIPSGNKRTTSFIGLNRAAAHTNKNRTMKFKL